MQFAAITSDHSLWSSAERKWCKITVADTGGGGGGGQQAPLKLIDCVFMFFPRVLKNEAHIARESI